MASKEEVVVRSSGGVGFFGLLAILFIGLKLTGYITWSWLWVLWPLWIPPLVFIGIFIILIVIVGLAVLGSVIIDKFK